MRRRSRFPRYAPDRLETRLNPSALVYVTSPMPVEVELAPATGTDPDPPDGSGDPPLDWPNSPIGPDLPA
jgi:hypothetical protein